jgi:hypothetical protein
MSKAILEIRTLDGEVACFTEEAVRTGIALTEDASSQEGTRWPVETAVNASAV